MRAGASHARQVEILHSEASRENRAWFGVAQNDRARRVTLTPTMEGRQEVES
jgi:hypothetical protein